MREHLLEGRQPPGGNDIAQVLADKINCILVEAVKRNTFSDKIFRVGLSSGGDYPVGGIFWERGVFSSLNASSVPQVFGHTPEAEIRLSPSERRVDIDVGIHCFEGRAYLTLRGGKPTAHKVP